MLGAEPTVDAAGTRRHLGVFSCTMLVLVLRRYLLIYW